MSQETVKTVRLMNAAFNRGDLDEAFGSYEPAALWHSRPDEPDTGDYHGLDAIRQMAAMWIAMFDQFQFDLDTKLAEIWEYRDRAEALEAVSLSG